MKNKITFKIGYTVESNDPIIPKSIFGGTYYGEPGSTSQIKNLEIDDLSGDSARVFYYKENGKEEYFDVAISSLKFVSDKPLPKPPVKGIKHLDEVWKKKKKN